MIVLIAKGLSVDYYYTTKNTNTVLTSSLKQAKRFKSMEEIDSYFSQDNWMFNMNWHDFYNVRALNQITVTKSIPLGWMEYHNWLQVKIKKSFNVNYMMDDLYLELGEELTNIPKQATKKEIEMLLEAGLDPYMFDF